MKRLIFILTLLSSCLTHAQTICAPCTFEWDAPPNVSGLTEYRLYLTQTQGVYDWGDDAATVPIGSTEAVDVSASQPGTWYAVVVASDGTLISRPSNEVSFVWPLNPDQTPGNLRIRITLGADGSMTLEVERRATN